MVYIAYITELIWQICDYAQKRRIDAKIVNTRLTEIFIAIFAPDERLPSSANLVSAGIRVIHSGPKSGGDLVMLFCGYCDDGVSAGIWVIHTGPKSGGELVTLFGGYCDYSVSAGIWVIQMGGKLVTFFDTYCHDGVDVF